MVKTPANDPEGIVKCGCGDVMRRRRWAAHWNGCRVGSGTPTTEPADIAAVVWYENYMQEKYGITV